jgi:hypothetical protein
MTSGIFSCGHQHRTQIDTYCTILYVVSSLEEADRTPTTEVCRGWFRHLVHHRRPTALSKCVAQVLKERISEASTWPFVGLFSYSRSHIRAHALLNSNIIVRGAGSSSSPAPGHSFEIEF